MTGFELQILARLARAVAPYVADQEGASDPQCGLVQPVTVAEAEELNSAYRIAWGFILSSRSPTDGSSDQPPPGLKYKEVE